MELQKVLHWIFLFHPQEETQGASLQCYLHCTFWWYISTVIIFLLSLVPFFSVEKKPSPRHPRASFPYDFYLSSFAGSNRLTEFPFLHLLYHSGCSSCRVRINIHSQWKPPVLLFTWLPHEGFRTFQLEFRKAFVILPVDFFISLSPGIHWFGSTRLPANISTFIMFPAKFNFFLIWSQQQIVSTIGTSLCYLTDPVDNLKDLFIHFDIVNLHCWQTLLTSTFCWSIM